MESDVEAIVSKLTKAQRKWLPLLTDTDRGLFPVGMAKATRDSFVTLGLLDRVAPRAFGMIKWPLTPLGLAVRTALLSQTKE